MRFPRPRSRKRANCSESLPNDSGAQPRAARHRLNSAITNARRSSVCSAVLGAWHALDFCRLRTKMLRYQIAASSRNGNDEDAG